MLLQDVFFLQVLAAVLAVTVLEALAAVRMRFVYAAFLRRFAAV